MTAAPKSVDEYLEHVPSVAAKDALTNLRKVIREAVPQAEEVISYGIPTYKFHGMVASFAAFKNHCSFFPGHTLRDFADQLKGYKTTKGGVQFPPDKPIPDALIKAMVQARAEENLADSK